MIVRRIDFTSAPSARKPITCATCIFDGGYLTVTVLDKLPDFASFECVLADVGPWIAGLDFPFGQARTLIADLGWPTDWVGYVAQVAALRREEFGTVLEGYRNGRATGAKQPRRPVDVAANACSPMMWYGVPVGKMFYEGAPRLLASPLSILPCRPTADDRIVVEAYPALVARRWIGKLSYKADERAKQTPEREAGRGAIVAGLQRTISSTPTAFAFRWAMRWPPTVPATRVGIRSTLSSARSRRRGPTRSVATTMGCRRGVDLMRAGFPIPRCVSLAIRSSPERY